MWSAGWWRVRTKAMSRRRISGSVKVIMLDGFDDQQDRADHQISAQGQHAEFRSRRTGYRLQQGQRRHPPTVLLGRVELRAGQILHRRCPPHAPRHTGAGPQGKRFAPATSRAAFVVVVQLPAAAAWSLRIACSTSWALIDRVQKNQSWHSTSASRPAMRSAATPHPGWPRRRRRPSAETSSSAAAHRSCDRCSVDSR